MVKHETREQYRERIQQDIDQQVNQTESYDDQPIAQPSQTTNDGGNGSNNNGNNGGNNWHPHRTGGWLKAFILLIILVILGAGGVEYHRIHSTAKGIFGAKSGKINPKLKRGEPISVLLMGTDVGALNRGNKGGNTDTLELMTINPKKQRISMTSIPRDTLVRVNTKEGADYVKINAAYYWRFQTDLQAGFRATERSR